MPAIPVPYVKIQYFDNSGNPLNGGKLYSFIAGTSTPKATYTDAGGLTANANPTILDSAGRADVWLLGPGAYKLRLDTSADVVLWTVDNVASTGGTSAITEAQVQTTVNASNGAAVLTAASLIPSGARVSGVFGEVTTAFGTGNGLTGINIGGMGVGDGWGANIALTLSTKTTFGNFQRGDTPIAASAQDVTLTALGGTFTAVGAMKLTVQYETGIAP